MQTDGYSVAADGRAGDGAIPEPFFDDEMSRYPLLAYSKRQVIQAGDRLRGDIPEHLTDEAIEIFRIAYNWRNFHAWPMHRVRHELAGRIRRLRADGTVTAARLKRMASIRKKLQRLPPSLVQIQDLGGCRAILRTIADVRAVRHSERACATFRSPICAGMLTLCSLHFSGTCHKM